jgi:hypothetical protein
MKSQVNWNNKIIEIQIIISTGIVRISEYFSKMLVLSGVFNTRILDTMNYTNQDYVHINMLIVPYFIGIPGLCPCLWGKFDLSDKIWSLLLSMSCVVLGGQLIYTGRRFSRPWHQLHCLENFMDSTHVMYIGWMEFCDVIAAFSNLLKMPTT